MPRAVMHAEPDRLYRPWPEASGPWQIRLDYGVTADRVACVGLHLKPLVDECPPLTATILRQLRLAELVDQDAERRLREARKRLGDAQQMGVGPTGEANLRRLVSDAERRRPQPAKRGRKPYYDDDHYRTVAASYMSAVQGGDRMPNVTLAQKYSVEKTTVASWVREARRRGLLPPAGHHHDGHRRRGSNS